MPRLFPHRQACGQAPADRAARCRCPLVNEGVDLTGRGHSARVSCAHWAVVVAPNGKLVSVFGDTSRSQGRQATGVLPSC